MRFWLIYLLSGFAVISPTALAETGTRFIIGTNPDLSQGAVELRLGNFEEGLRLTLIGLKDPTTSRRNREAALNNLCAGYMGVGEFDQAIYVCNIVLSANERSWRAYNNRALAYLGAGELDRARHDVDKGLAINPDSQTLKQVAELVERYSDAPHLIPTELRWFPRSSGFRLTRPGVIPFEAAPR